ncbi:MAG: carbohydrate ABC transporter permease [Hungatella sp.]|nr:carbohydrate ABC transporter permease [Hungatella sp.]
MTKKKYIIHLILFMVCLLVWLPLMIMVAAALMPEDELYWRYLSPLGLGKDKVRITLLPSYLSLDALEELLIRSPGFFVMFWNSCIQVLPMLLGQLLVGMPAAWAFARFEFVGRRWLFGIYVILMVLPFQVTQVSNYLVLDQTGLLNTHFALIMPGIWSTLPVFIMTKSFETVPKVLMEAAYLDGAGEFYTFLHIGVPLGYPGIVTALLLSFVDGWNALEQPITYLKDKTLWPISLYLPDIARDKAAVAFAAALITCLLPILVYLNCQEELEQGVAASGVKQ